MIAGFDHVVIATQDIRGAAQGYETLLGRAVDASVERDGVATAIIRTSNIAVELIAPVGEGEGARRVRATLEEGEGLKSIVLAVDDIERAHRRLERVGLAPETIKDGPTDGNGPAWRSCRLNTERTHGVRLFLMQRTEKEPPPAPDSAVTSLDHVVIRTAEPERAAALYGARLGLDMRLDRVVAGRHLMFFRCGDAIVEIAHDPACSDGRDRVWGLSWRVADADAARQRLARAGLDVSEVRAGKKPGTRVFTVRSGTRGVPTLMIEPSRRRD